VATELDTAEFAGALGAVGLTAAETGAALLDAAGIVMGGIVAVEPLIVDIAWVTFCLRFNQYNFEIH